MLTGDVSKKYESGGLGVTSISSGRGDAGGVSYGTYQLSSKTGTMDAFLASDYGRYFKDTYFGINRPGTSVFNAIYKKVSTGDDAASFAKAQFLFIKATHYKPLSDKLEGMGYPEFDKRSDGVQECLFSVAVQYGPATKLVENCTNPADDDITFIKKVQNYRRDSVSTYFRSSSRSTQRSVARRADNELGDLLRLV